MALQSSSQRSRPPSLPRTLDLRRKDKQELAELLVARAKHLPDAERVLMELVFREGKKVSELAGIIALDARAARRRVREISRRLLDPRFAYVIARRETWPLSRRRVANACIVEGRTLRDASSALQMSLYRVRELRNAIEHAFEESKGLRRAMGGAA